MKKCLFVLMAFVLVACGNSCKKFAGEPLTKNFGIEGSYTAIEVQDAFDVVVSDAVDSITITVGEKVMPYVIVEVVDNTLKIRISYAGGFYGGEQKAIIPLNADLTKVDLSGASEFHTTYGLEAEKVEVELSGASDFYGDITANKVDFDLSGASSFNGNVETTDAYIEMSGSSDYNGDILSDIIKADLSGSSNIVGNVTADNLELILSGSSDAKLIGNVAALKIDLAGSSNIVEQVVDHHYALACGRCEGTMSGASEAYIHCDGTIKVDLSGASELHFTGEGNPADCTLSGSSEVIHDVLP